MSLPVIVRSARVNSLARMPIVNRSYGRALSFPATASKLDVSRLTLASPVSGGQQAFHSSTLHYSSNDQYATVPITLEQYHKLTNVFFDKLVPLLEDVCDSSKIKDMDVDYADGMLTVIYPPHGTYVINKQGPSRQIWLSSPISGPKRFDFVGGSTWIYRRDGKVTVLRDLLKQELDVDIDAEGSG